MSESVASAYSPLDTFKGVFESAVQGASQIAARRETLLPVLFFVSKSGTVEICGWMPDKQMRNSVPEIRQLAKDYHAHALVFVAEATAVDSHGEGLTDVAIVYGYYPRTWEPKVTGVPLLVTYEIVDGELIPQGVTLEDKHVSWVKDVLRPVESAEDSLLRRAK